jgi:hypothetical protein
MSKTIWSFRQIRAGYRKLDGADKILFWVHFAVAPALMIGATFSIFGWAAICFWSGLFLFLGSRA